MSVKKFLAAAFTAIAAAFAFTGTASAQDAESTWSESSARAKCVSPYSTTRRIS